MFLSIFLLLLIVCYAFCIDGQKYQKQDDDKRAPKSNDSRIHNSNVEKIVLPFTSIYSALEHCLR